MSAWKSGLASERRRPHRTTGETLTSSLSLSPPLPPSLRLLCGCTWPLHVPSFPLLHAAFSSRRFSLGSVRAASSSSSSSASSSSSLPFLPLNSSFSAVCLPQSVSSLLLSSASSSLSFSFFASCRISKSFYSCYSHHLISFRSFLFVKPNITNPPFASESFDIRAALYVLRKEDTCGRAAEEGQKTET